MSKRYIAFIKWAPNQPDIVEPYYERLWSGKAGSGMYASYDDAIKGGKDHIKTHYKNVARGHELVVFTERDCQPDELVTPPVQTLFNVTMKAESLDRIIDSLRTNVDNGDTNDDDIIILAKLLELQKQGT